MRQAWRLRMRTRPRRWIAFASWIDGPVPSDAGIRPICNGVAEPANCQVRLGCWNVDRLLRLAALLSVLAGRAIATGSWSAWDSVVKAAWDAVPLILMIFGVLALFRSLAPPGSFGDATRCIQRVPCSMNTRTYSLFSSTVSTCSKSMASIPAAWACRNSRQLGPQRRGAGSMPAACRIYKTVDGATAMPSFISSPWIRR